jgi:hypothetical protein
MGMSLDVALLFSVAPEFSLNTAARNVALSTFC